MSKLLQHKILQMCNEQISYTTSLQVLGVICISIDNGSEEILVKINNTLKRVIPPSKNDKQKELLNLSNNIMPVINKFVGQEYSEDKNKIEKKRTHHGRKQTHPIRLVNSIDDLDVINPIDQEKEKDSLNENEITQSSIDFSNKFENIANNKEGLSLLNNKIENNSESLLNPVLDPQGIIDSAQSNSSVDGSGNIKVLNYGNIKTLSIFIKDKNNTFQYDPLVSEINKDLILDRSKISDHSSFNISDDLNMIYKQSLKETEEKGDINNFVQIKNYSGKNVINNKHNCSEDSFKKSFENLDFDNYIKNLEAPSPNDKIDNPFSDSESPPPVKRRLLDVLKNKKLEVNSSVEKSKNFQGSSNNPFSRSQKEIISTNKDYIITNNTNNLNIDLKPSTLKTFFNNLPLDTHYLWDNNIRTNMHTNNLLSFNHKNIKECLLDQGLLLNSNNDDKPHQFNLKHDNKNRVINGFHMDGILNLETKLRESSSLDIGNNRNGREFLRENANDKSGMVFINNEIEYYNNDQEDDGDDDELDKNMKIKKEIINYSDSQEGVLNLTKPGRSAIKQKSLKLKDLMDDNSSPIYNSETQFLKGWNYLMANQANDISNPIYSGQHYLQKLAASFNNKKKNLNISNFLTPKKSESTHPNLVPSPGLENEYLMDSFSVGVNGSSPLVSSMSKNVRRSRKRQTEDSLSTEEIAEYVGCNDSKSPSLFSKYKCLYCSELCENLSIYFRHTLTIHGAFICHECGKNFTTKSSLLRHRPIHTGMRRFTCSICQKSFYRKDKCKAHIKRHLELAHIAKEMNNGCKLNAFNEIYSTNDDINNYTSNINLNDYGSDKDSKDFNGYDKVLDMEDINHIGINSDIETLNKENSKKDYKYDNELVHGFNINTCNSPNKSQDTNFSSKLGIKLDISRLISGGDCVNIPIKHEENIETFNSPYKEKEDLQNKDTEVEVDGD